MADNPLNDNANYYIWTKIHILQYFEIKVELISYNCNNLKPLKKVLHTKIKIHYGTSLGN